MDHMFSNIQGNLLRIHTDQIHDIPLVLALAAPDLLSACELQEWYMNLKAADTKPEAELRATLGISGKDTMRDAISSIRRAAIAKAKGGA